MVNHVNNMSPRSVTQSDLMRYTVDEEGGVTVPEDLIGVPFPLRQMVPGAVDYLVAQKRFSVAQIKKVLRHLRIDDISPSDHAAFYNAYLKFVERKPGAAVILEIGALGVPGASSNKIHKKPVHALKLSSRVDAADLLTRAAENPVPDELMIALFFETAYAQFNAAPANYKLPQNMNETWFGDIDDTDEDTGGRQGCRAVVEPLVADIQALVSTRDSDLQNNDWMNHATDLANSFSNQDGRKEADKDTFLSRIHLAELMTGRIGIDSPPEAFNSIITLLERARDQNIEAEVRDASAAIGTLVAAGVIEDTKTAWLEARASEDLDSTCETLVELAQRLTAIAADGCEASIRWTDIIKEGVAKKEFAAVAEAAKYAEDAKAVSDTAAAEQVALREGIQSIFNTAESSLEDLFLLVGDWEVKCKELEENLSALRTGAGRQKSEAQNKAEQKVTDLGIQERSDDTRVIIDDCIQIVEEDDYNPASSTHATGDSVCGSTRDAAEDQALEADPSVDVELRSSTPASSNAPYTDPGHNDISDAANATERLIGHVAAHTEISELFSGALEAKTPEIGAVVSQALEQQGKSPLIRSQVFRAISAGRAVGFEFSPATDDLHQQFSEAASDANEEESVLLFAAALNAAIFVPETSLRVEVSNLNLGSFGPHLSRLQTAIGELPFAFPPSQEVLAQLSGAPTESPRARIVRRLEKWMQETEQRSGPCQPSTKFLHTIVKPTGIIGSAMCAMREGSKESAEMALDAAARLDGPELIQGAVFDVMMPMGSRSTSKLSPESINYLTRRGKEAVALLRAWADAKEKKPKHATAKAQRTLAALRTQITKAKSLVDERIGVEAGDTLGRLRTSIAKSVLSAIATVQQGLEGTDTDEDARPTTVDDAGLRDIDRLPPVTRRALHVNDFETVLRHIEETGIPDPQMSYELNISAGAFLTARRLKETPSQAEKTLAEAQRSFVMKFLHDLKALSYRITTTARLDFKNQERYPALTDWCEATQRKLDQSVSDDLIFVDFDADWARLAQITDDLATAEKQICIDQRDRVENLRTPSNEAGANLILRLIDDEIGFEAIENRIARLRDGKPVDDYKEDQETPDLMEVFTRNLVDARLEDGWPATPANYESAFKSDLGPLAMHHGRAENAVEVMGHFTALRHSVMKNKIDRMEAVALLQGLGFEDVSLAKETRIQGRKAWYTELRSRVTAQEWFLPPVFGTGARGLYRLLLCDPKVLPDQLRTTLDPSVPTLILVTGRLDSVRRYDYARQLRKDKIPALLVDETLTAFSVACTATPIQCVFACGPPYGRVEPYVTSAGALPEEMFFGREEEIERIMSYDYEGCLVHGGRQLGKSALLAHIQKIHHNPDDDIIVVRDQVTNLGLPDYPASHVWNRIHRLLLPFNTIVRPGSKDDPDAICPDIQAWVMQTEKRRRVIVLLDEADEFISAESVNGFPNITKLKELMEFTGRKFKIVFAGLHNVQRLHNVPNSPLPHLRTSTVIGPLNRTREDREAAYELVTAPMRAAGFKFESHRAAERILSYTNEYPSLVQEYMSGLITQRHKMLGRSYALPDDGPLWAIPDRELFKHEGFSDIESKIRDKFKLTLKLDVRYALVAYTLAYIAQEDRQKALLDGMRARDILDEAFAYWPESIDRLDVAGFEVILDEMCDLGVLGTSAGNSGHQASYCLRSPEILPMLGTPADIEEELLRINDEEPRPLYDKATFRRAVPTESDKDPKYLPLTDMQIVRLFDRADNSPRIVCGLRLLGLDDLGRYLERFNDDSSLPGVRPDRPVSILSTDDQNVFRKVLDKRPRQKGEMKVLLHIFNGLATDAQKLLQIASQRPHVSNGHIRPILLLNAAVSDLRDLATRNLYPTEYLSPWGPDALRMHLRQMQATDLDQTEIRNRILEETGGVPDRVVEIVNKLHLADDRDALLAGINVTLPHQALLPDLDRLKKDLEVLHCYDDENPSQKDYNDLNALALDHTGKDLETLVPDLQAMGLVQSWVADRYHLRLSSLVRYLYNIVQVGLP